MSKRAARVTRMISAGAVASSVLLAAGAGCAGVCGVGPSGPHPVKPPARTGWEDTATFEPTRAEARRSTDRAPGHPESAPVLDAVLTATEPPRGAEWAGADDAAAAAPGVNLFGELDGVRRGPARPVGESGFQQHTSVDEGEDGDVAVDPTGRWLAFSSTRHHESGDIYLQRVDGTAVTQLTNDAARDAFPAFSPDGKTIAFSSTRAGNWQIYRMDVDGRDVVQVTSGPTNAIHPSFSPDGTRLVYCALGARSGQWELWTVHLVSGERRQVGYGLFPSWSPDKAADRIAYQRARQRGSRWFSLWTMDLVDGEGRRNTEVAVSSNAAIVSPCWSPDGKKLAFTTVVQPGPGTGPAAAGAARGAAAAGQQDVWIVDAGGANKQRLTDGNGSNLVPAWAADNRVYFVSDRGGNESIWSVRADAADAFTATAGRKADPFAPATATTATDAKEVGGH